MMMEKQSFALSSRDICSLGALLLLLAGEFFAFKSIHCGWLVWWPGILVAGLLLALLWGLSLMAGYKFNLRSEILTKLLANAIVPQVLGTAYLFLFVIHIGWLTNAAMNLFMPYDLSDVLISVAVCMAALFVLIVFFPSGKNAKESVRTEIIFSGMSYIFIPKSYEELNLRPLAMILRDKDLSRCELQILRSNYGTTTDEKLSESIKSVLAFVFKHAARGDGEESDRRAAARLAGEDINNQLRILIREVIRKEFPDKPGIDELKIGFTAPCDYNDFRSCFDALSAKVREKDKPVNQLLFYISPGTSLVGSVITLMAIDGKRELYYYSQHKNEKEADRLKYIDKKEIPLKNLLSQALETLEENHA